MEPPPNDPQEPPPPRPGPFAAVRRLFAPAVGLFALLSKLKGLVVVAKFLPLLKSGGSLLIFAAVEAWAFGWPAAVILITLLVIHSAGHLAVLKAQRREATPFLFIPFLGGGAGARSRADVATKDALVSIMGPVFGGAAAWACIGLYLGTGSRLWLVMGSLGFLINLFQLAPVPMLDGGNIVMLLSPKLLLPGIAVLFLIAPTSPIVWILALISIPTAIALWRAKPSEDPYLAQVTAADRWRYGLAYLALGIALAVGSRFCDDQLHEIRRLVG